MKVAHIDETAAPGEQAELPLLSKEFLDQVKADMAKKRAEREANQPPAAGEIDYIISQR